MASKSIKDGHWQLKENCIAAAMQCTSYAEFRKRFCGARAAALENGWNLEIRSLYNNPRQFWDSKDKCRDAAKQCHTRSEFQKRFNGAYNRAYKDGYLDEICSHMEKVGNLNKRKIYVFEFEDNYAYVGLTCNPRRRKYDHVSDDKSAVYKHICDTHSKFTFKTLTDWLSYDVAGDIEDEYIEEYRSAGWNMLNRVRGGSLGGLLMRDPSTWKYKLEELKAEAAKYKNRRAFKLGNHKMYSFCYCHGLLDVVCKGMKTLHHWTDENLKRVIRICPTPKELHAKYPGAYSHLKENGQLWEIYKKRKSYVEWSDDEIFEAVAQCNGRKEFGKKYPSLYLLLLDEDRMNYFFGPKTPKWTDELLWAIVRRCKNRKELYDKYNGAYQFLLRNNRLDEFFGEKERFIRDYTDDELLYYVKKAGTRFKLQTKYPGVYKVICKQGRLDEFFGGTYLSKNYSDDEIRVLVSGCKSRKDFSRKYSGLYKYLCHGNRLNDFFPPKTKRAKDYSDEELLQMIRDCGSRKMLRQKHSGVYMHLLKSGRLDILFERL